MTPALPRMAERGEGDPALLALDGVGFLLGVAHRTHRRRWEQALSDLGLTAPQAALLRLITAEPGRGVRHLSRRLGTDPMNVQRIAETLVAAGHCEVGRDPADGRRRPLYPTPAGRRLATSVAGRARDAERHLAAALGDEAYPMLVTALRAVVELDEGNRGTTTVSEETHGPADHLS